jgi:hypothetical protein
MGGSSPTSSRTGLGGTAGRSRLVLHGPAGGEFGSGTAGPEFALDAVESCRAWEWSGTTPFATRVPF